MKTSSKFKPSLLIPTALMLLPGVAHAHPGHGSSGFAHGLVHPLMGLDHVVAMIAVGLWAVQLGGRAKWMIPLSFVTAVGLGTALGTAHFPLPLVEAGILASVLAVGSLLALSVRLPLVASMALVGVFALFHGFAHGVELDASASGASYGVGLMLATALLHSVGVGAGSLLAAVATKPALRLAGVAVVSTGAALFVS